jgi:hypothetical protein
LATKYPIWKEMRQRSKILPGYLLSPDTKPGLRIPGRFRKQRVSLKKSWFILDIKKPSGRRQPEHGDRDPAGGPRPEQGEQDLSSATTTPSGRSKQRKGHQEPEKGETVYPGDQGRGSGDRRTHRRYWHEGKKE